MNAVITGDIINSRKSRQYKWQAPLKKLLSRFGKFPKDWETSRGDSFQVEIREPEKSLLAAITIKALVKSLGIKKMDVRLAIGIGEISYHAPRISDASGTAFIYAGEKFETLKKIKQNLAIKTAWPSTDREINLMLRLALIAMDKWTVPSAELAFLIFMEKYSTGKILSQKELEIKLKLKQSSVSERHTRAQIDEIKDLLEYFSNRIKNPLTS